MPHGKWATVREAAEHYGVTRQRIHQLVAQGFLGKTRIVKGFGHDLMLIPYPFSRKSESSGRPKKEV